MNFSQKQLAIIGAVAAALVLIGVLVFLNVRPSQSGKVQLTVWGFEKPEAIGGIIAGYSQLRQSVQVSYRQVSRDNYTDALLNALASGQGPDVFPVHNRGLAKNLNVLYPAPAAQFGDSQMANLFPAAAEQDFVFASGTAKQVYALPLYFDTLSLIYNKDLLDQGGVANPPSTWEEFQNGVAKLKNISSGGQIVRAAAAIGGSQKTVTNAVDLLNVLIQQNGTAMIFNKNASFASETGLAAFRFYLQFANPVSDYYTWNDSQPNDLDSFSSGKTAMVFGYNSDIQKIKNKSPFLRFGVAPLPQADLSNAVNYADYWGLAVSKQSRNPQWAWDFILYMTTQPQAAGQYSALVNQPPALRELISGKINDPLLGVFAKQALTARSWSQPDETRVKSVFNNAILSVLAGQSDTRKILTQAQDQVTQLMNNQ